MASEVAARVADVVKTYRTEVAEVRALRGIHAEFPRAAVTAVVGPSGSGKSTLLRLLAGIDRADAGTIHVADRELTALSARDLRKVRRGLVGYVFQRPGDNFIPYLSVREHMHLAARAGAAFDPDQLLERLGILARYDHYPHQLSGGEQQRAAFAQVLVAGPPVVVADEPTAELDHLSGNRLIEVVESLRDTGVAFVIATHDKSVAELADHSIEIENGSIRQERVRGAFDAARRRAPAPDLIAAARSTGAARRAWTRPPGGVRGAASPVPEPTSDEPGAVVSVRNVVKRFRRGDETVHALEDVSLDLRPGRVAGLMGRSGSGKTTLLSVIGGWEGVDAGSIVWSGGESHRSWQRLAIVPQKLGLLDELTVRENVAYPARLTGRAHELDELVDELLDRFGLTETADRAPSATSMGQQQRTAIARALILSPDVLLADEPSGHQDAGWAAAIFNALRDAAAAGTSILVATHNVELKNMLDEVVEMEDGRILVTPGSDP